MWKYTEPARDRNYLNLGIMRVRFNSAKFLVTCCVNLFQLERVIRNGVSHCGQRPLDGRRSGLGGDVHQVVGPGAGKHAALCGCPAAGCQGTLIG